MRTIFEARLLFALRIIRFVLGLSDNKHLILLFPRWPCAGHDMRYPETRRGQWLLTTPCYDNTDTRPGSWQIFDRVVNISYHHPDNDLPTMPQILTSHLIMDHCNRSSVAVEAWWWWWDLELGTIGDDFSKYLAKCCEFIIYWNSDNCSPIIVKCGPELL